MNISSLLSQLLFFTRLEQGTEKYLLENLDFSQLVRSMCDDRMILLSSSQELITEIEDNVSILGNSGLLSRLLSNLLDNAYKYSGDNAVVKVELKDKGDLVELKVSDNGIGISPENLNKIWNRFYREDSSRNSENSFGLGLAMVKEIADFHGGRLNVSSIQGSGSTFIFSMPK